MNKLLELKEWNQKDTHFVLCRVVRQESCFDYNRLHTQCFGNIAMYAHRVDATLSREGALVLTNLPFHAGEKVEVIVMPRSTAAKSYLLRGKSVVYIDPLEPVAQSDGEAQH